MVQPFIKLFQIEEALGLTQGFVLRLMILVLIGTYALGFDSRGWLGLALEIPKLREPLNWGFRNVIFFFYL